MQKIFYFFIELFSWLLIFLSPALAFGFVAGAVYINNPKNAYLSIIVLVIGIIIGVIIAERIRRKYGCSSYLGRISATPDIWSIDEEDRKKEK